MRRVLLVAVCLSVAASIPLPSISHAQDDWGVKRDPFDRRIVNRYKAILRKNPGDRAALNKLRGLYRRYRSVVNGFGIVSPPVILAGAETESCGDSSRLCP